MARKALPISILSARLRAAYPDARCALDHGDPFQLVVATVLSAQCTDARVNLTTPALFGRFPDADRMADADVLEIEEIIRSTGFYHNKARNIKALAMALREHHGGQVPATLETLAALPGVGQKTANVVLANAFGIPALAVDTHIFRVARRLGLSKGTTPEKVEADLCALFPRDSWIELHHQLIIHGRRVCDARKPDCAGCPLLEACPTGLGQQSDPHSGRVLDVAAGPRAEQAETVSAPGAGPGRIISLVPSVTELLAQWGLGSRLAGRTDFCVEPRWIRNTVPAMGGTKNPDIPRILSQRPDLVILERDENTRETAQALETAGVPLLVLEIHSLKDCLAAFRILGDAVGAPEAARAREASLKALLKPVRKKGPRALALVWKDPWMAAGPDTYVADVLRQAGLTPVGPGRYPVLSTEDLEALELQVLLLPSEPYRFSRRHAEELAKRLPSTTVRLVDGRALTWYLSRSEEALRQLTELVKELP
jgi:endonuclease-3